MLELRRFWLKSKVEKKGRRHRTMSKEEVREQLEIIPKKYQDNHESLLCKTCHIFMKSRHKTDMRYMKFAQLLLYEESLGDAAGNDFDIRCRLVRDVRKGFPCVLWLTPAQFEIVEEAPFHDDLSDHRLFCCFSILDPPES